MAAEEHKKVIETRGDWVTYRPEIKLLDCTVRDGGLMNEHPRAAIKWLDSDQADDFVGFYDQMLEED